MIKVIFIVIGIVNLIATMCLSAVAKKADEDLKKILDLRIEDNDIFDKYK